MGSSLTSTLSQTQSLPPKLLVCLEDFEKHLRLQKKRSPATLKSYLAQAQSLLEFLWNNNSTNFSADPNISSVLEDPDPIRSHLREASTSLHANSQAQKVSALKCFFKFLIEKYSCRKELIRTLERPKTPRPLIKVIPEEILQSLRQILKTDRPLKEQLLFELLYGSGLRISEVTNIKWEDLALHSQQAPRIEIMGKGRKRRVVPLTPQSIELAKLLKAEMAITASKKNVFCYDVRTLRSWVNHWALLLPENDLKIHPHLLRHSIASHLLRRGAHLPEIQRLLGHSKLSTTERYTHLNLDELVHIYDKSFKLN